MQKFGIGQPVWRVEGVRFITGQDASISLIRASNVAENLECD